MWRDSRAGARAGRGFRFQDVVGTATVVSIWAGDRLPARVVPEGFDDIVLEHADLNRYLQVKSRQPHLAPFSASEVASVLLEGWQRHGARLDAEGDFVLVLEKGPVGLAEGEYRLQHLELAEQVRPLLAAEVGREMSEAIIRRSDVWVWPDPEQKAIERLAVELSLPEAACAAHVNALKTAVGRCADANASATEAQRHGLSVTDTTATIDEVTRHLDQDALLGAVSRDICEAVSLLTPINDPSFYTGVDVTPGHIAAGLTVRRPEALAEVDEALSSRRAALVAGPSGSGKSAVLWMTAYEDRRCRWYRVRQLGSSDQVTALVRLARALMPTEHAPVGFVVDNVGRPGTEAWDALVEEVAAVPHAFLLGAAREEDLFIVRTLPRVQVVRLQMDERLASEVFGKLRARGQTQWQHWREPYEQSRGLLLEYAHLLTSGQRLGDVITEQVRTRRREERRLELAILSLASTAASWEASLPLENVVAALGEPDAAVSAALERLVGEHLLQQRADGSIGGVHRLRSRAIFTAVHDHPPPTVGTSVARTIAVVDLRHVQSFLIGVLTELPAMADEVISATAARLVSTSDIDLAVATFQAMRIAEFARTAQRWLVVFDEHHTPAAMRPLGAGLTLSGSDLASMVDILDPRLVGAVQQLQTGAAAGSELRRALLAALPRGWVVGRLLQQSSCGSAAELLAAVEGMSDAVWVPGALSGFDGSLLETALVSADVDELAAVLGAARSVCVEAARDLATAVGGTAAILKRIEEGTPWCRNLRMGLPTQDLLDGREVNGLAGDALVARVEYRYVSDADQPDIHGDTVGLARKIMASVPDLDLVHAVAVDAREKPHGVGDFEVANTWLKRSTIPTQDQIAWNRARIRIVESSLAASNHTDGLATELQLLGRTAALLERLTSTWLTGRGGGQGALVELDTERRELIRAVDELPPAPHDPGHSADPLEAGTTSTPDPVSTLLRICLVQVVSGIAGTSDRLSSVAALLTDRVAKSLAASADPERWRLLGYDQTPEPVTRLTGLLHDVRAVAAELAFGDVAPGRLREVARSVPRSQALRATAQAAGQSAHERFEGSLRHGVDVLEKLGVLVEPVTRPAPPSSIAWPPIDSLLLVHVRRLDAWPSVVEGLSEARRLFSDVHRVSAVPVREGLVIPFLAIAVGMQGTSPQEESLDGWSGRDALSALGSGANSAFRSVISAAARLSSFAALPGGPRFGDESAAAQMARDDLDEALDALKQYADGQGDAPLLNLAVSVADSLVAAAVDEFETGADAGELARWALELTEGREDELAADELAAIVSAVSLMLAEWDIAPEAAARWFEEVNQPTP